MTEPHERLPFRASAPPSGAPAPSSRPLPERLASPGLLAASVLHRLAVSSLRWQPTRLEAALLRIERTRGTVVPAPKPQPPNRSDRSDRREYPRHDSRCVVWVHRCEAAGPLSRPQREWLLHATRLKGWLIDISMNGVAFVIPDRVEGGSRLLLRLANPRLDRHIDIEADVLRVSTGPEGWKVVCHLRRHLTLEQVVQLGRHLFDSRLV